MTHYTYTTLCRKISQEATYYPFGMAIPSQSFALPNENNIYQNRYFYNGKEYQDDFGLNWYDYGARFYDAQIGRWHSVDPLAEKYYQWSPYNYVVNNPINAIDPDGREPISLTLLAIRATIGAAIDFSAQMTINQTIHGQTFGTAFRNVDWVSVGTSAVIGAATIPGLGTTARTATIATAAVTNGAVDVRIDGGTTTIAGEKEIGAGIIDAVGSAANFKASDAVVGGSKRMVSSEIQSGTFSTLNNAEKNLVRQTNRVVNSEGYNAGVSAATSVANEAAKVGANAVTGSPLAIPSAENNFAPAATTNVARPLRLSLEELNQR